LRSDVDQKAPVFAASPEPIEVAPRGDAGEAGLLVYMREGGGWHMAVMRGFLAIQARSQDDSISLPLDAKPAGCGVRRLSTAEDEAPESPVRVRPHS
jgi:hypothetical protein